ncbi:AraC-like DNA-binding protein [Crossiella equi]|uniref:AraC-like DNA-binding protein n=1 Tax=Crossiella equi TaxID=130796 RepID=A0ABS5ARG6_9PSEU|nr:AraC family transcriptional regulator [Crossiella equi]MBP2479164.1 AraC-like DNA-binding protein [Crossiella equi]
MDVLSEVLRLLDVRAAESSRFEAAGEWALAFHGSGHIKVGALLSGSCWLTVHGAEPVLLKEGDCYLMASGQGYQAGSHPDLPPADGHAVFAGVFPAPVHYRTDQDGERTVLVGGAITFDETTAGLLFEQLPAAVRIPGDSPAADVVHPVLQLLAHESASAEPGAASMRDQLTQLLFTQALRTLLTDGRAPGFLGALRDPAITRALTLLHREPARPWTVAGLAAEVSLSRSTFAQRFRDLVGLPPLDYLARWRLHSAERALRHGDRTVSSVAAEFGYRSESAFSTAFKRVLGRSPGSVRR